MLQEENVASAITGASRPDQIEENVTASGVAIDDGVLAQIDEILGEAVGP